MTLERMLEDLKEHEYVNIPIKSLDGLRCNVTFELCKRDIQELSIPTDFGIHIFTSSSFSPAFRKDKTIAFYNGYGTNNIPLTIEGLQSAIDTLDKIKFSKKDNMFLYEEEDTYEDLFISKNYESIYEDCSVCLEKTCRKTSCSHSLCLRCYLKIEKKCPICRDCIRLDAVDTYPGLQV